MGLRNANSYLVEISYRVVEDIVDTTTTAPVAAGVQTVGVNSTLAIYVGAQIVISDGTHPDAIIIITGLDNSSTPPTITADFPTAFNSGATLYAGTFPTQQPTDPLFTQSEVLGYLARAQNEFLSKLPCIFAFATQSVQIGVTRQSAPADAIEIERVAVYNGDVYTRLYETTQEQIALRDPQWFYDATQAELRAWYEDRTGYYGWGVAPVPGSNFAVELLYSQRGPDTLGLLDTLLVPDCMGIYVKMKALQYIFEKDGEQRSPEAARLYSQRFDQGIMICDRYLRGQLEAAANRSLAGAL